MRVIAASDRALLIVFDDAITPEAGRAVRRLHVSLTDAPLPGVVDLHPAYVSLLVRFDPLVTDRGVLAASLAARASGPDDRVVMAARVIDVPVRYGGPDGPDLQEVARATRLSSDAVVALHTSASYEVRFLGFSPGFPYLAGLPPALFTPRRPSPRRRVAAGSVAIAGWQAGIYPLASPGGWNVIGRTDLTLFDPDRDPAALLAPGDQVRFVALDAAP
jgi:KipI family sensor histidine kinase inhibitor